MASNIENENIDWKELIQKMAMDMNNQNAKFNAMSAGNKTMNIKMNTINEKKIGFKSYKCKKKQASNSTSQ